MSAESLSLTGGGGTIGSRKKRKHRLQKELNAYARAGMKLWVEWKANYTFGYHAPVHDPGRRGVYERFCKR